MPEERGLHAEAARVREGALAGKLRAAADTDSALSTAVGDARSAALAAARRLDAIDSRLQAAVTGRAFGVDTPAGARRFSGLLAATVRDIEQVVADTVVDEATRAALLATLAGRYPSDATAEKPTIQAVDNRYGRTDAEHARNQADAFAGVFGRAPSSATDWATAAALDTHTYDPDFQGTDSQVQIARIRPVPGQGVVRIGQWIAQRDVTSFPPPRRDLGNNRGTDVHFDPEATKVATYIDYENGIVVLRQNPSVEQHADGSAGQVRIGAPHGSVTQAGDGSVRIRYDAGNPFAPQFSTDPRGPLGTHRFSVNGDLVVSPGANGVRIDGTRTDYPSLEAYQDLPGGPTRTVLIDPAHSGRSLGPVLNLPRHHDLGIGGRAFAPFDRAGPVIELTPAPPPGRRVPA